MWIKSSERGSMYIQGNREKWSSRRDGMCDQSQNQTIVKTDSESSWH